MKVKREVVQNRDVKLDMICCNWCVIEIVIDPMSTKN